MAAGMKAAVVWGLLLLFVGCSALGGPSAGRAWVTCPRCRGRVLLTNMSSAQLNAAENGMANAARVARGEEALWIVPPV